LQETVIARSRELVEADLVGVLAVEDDIKFRLGSCRMYPGRFVDFYRWSRPSATGLDPEG